jgi:pimeloyl-ACP methyl ester carboxylesterase
MTNTGANVRLQDSAPDTVQIRVHGPVGGATLVYFPGLHGDWTLLGGFRRVLDGKVRLVEIAYPRTLEWSLSDYGRGVEGALAQKGVTGGWLLGESFGSQVVWEILKQGTFRTEGVILAGGFARHPAPWMARLAFQLSGEVSFRLIRLFLALYAGVARVRFRRSPETIAGIYEFIERRTLQDCRAARHRLELVAQNRPQESVRLAKVPLYLLTGFFDPIVPWFPASRWIERNCRSFAGRRVIWGADHNVLATAPEAAASQILQWCSRRPATNQAPEGV